MHHNGWRLHEGSGCIRSVVLDFKYVSLLWIFFTDSLYLCKRWESRQSSVHWFLFFLSLPVLLCPETAAVVQNGLLRVFAQCVSTAKQNYMLLLMIAVATWHLKMLVMMTDARITGSVLFFFFFLQFVLNTFSLCWTWLLFIHFKLFHIAQGL